MRRQEEQLELTRPPIEHPHAAELEEISRILDANPRMAALVAQDLVRGVKNPHTGSPGLTGDQVLRILILKQTCGFSFEELAFHLADSTTYRAFCRLGAFEETPARSTLAENLKKVGPKTLEKVQRRLVRYAISLGVEKGRKVRIDSTVVEANIHAPTDSSLLFDAVRVLTRLLERAGEEFGFTRWSDHTKRAKRRMLAVSHTGSEKKRAEAYRNLLKVTRKTAGYAEWALEALRAVRDERRAHALTLAEKLREIVTWTWAVIDQTERRVFLGEVVPAEEKVVSLFEPHTDIIVKDRRETLYGHKIFLSAGASGLITDCVITEGNPADSTMATPMLKRQKRILGKMPRQAAFDGCFASKQNLREGKALGVEDLSFSKKRGLQVHEMVRSSWVYRRLRDFRAGIEGVISFLTRAFDLSRCSWRGEESFASYVLAGVISANLLTLARHLLG